VRIVVAACTVDYAGRLSASLPQAFREPQVNLWIGPGGHLVHYPIRAGAAVNIVAVTSDHWQSTQWSTAADRDEMLARFPPLLWAGEARELLAAPERWQKWALYDRAPSTDWGHGPVTLLGDASYDFKDIRGLAPAGLPGTLLPSYEGGFDPIVQRQFATDDWMLNVDNPSVVIPDFFGGRIPAL